MPDVSLRRFLAASCLLAAVALTAGCGTRSHSGAPPGTGTAPPAGTTPPASTAPPTPAARQVYFDPGDVRTPQASVVLTRSAEVTRFVAWLNTRPRPGMASGRLVAALREAPIGDQALVVVSRLVGCDSVGSVELRRQGTNFSLATLAVTHHEECLRANRLVAVFAVPKASLPANPTIDGAAPDTGWK
jgi:hypothetical protein